MANQLVKDISASERTYTPADPALAEGLAYTNGEYVPIKEAGISLLDWGFSRSDAFQDTISVWKGHFFRLDDHIQRFERSASRLRMTPPPRQEIRGILNELVALTGFRDAYIQFLMTRGVPPIGNRDIRNCVNRFYAYCIPYVWIATPEVQERGLQVHLSNRRRIPPVSVDPCVKHYHWLDFEMGLLDAYDSGAETVLVRDIDGGIAEGPGFNAFIVTGGEIVTPEPKYVLDGMTRRSVIEILQEEKLPFAEQPIAVEEFKAADEVFLTSTAGGILPVSNIDGQLVGDGKPGPTTKALRGKFWSKRENGWYATPVTYR